MRRRRAALWGVIALLGGLLWGALSLAYPSLGRADLRGHWCEGQPDLLSCWAAQWLAAWWAGVTWGQIGWAAYTVAILTVCRGVWRWIGRVGAAGREPRWP